MRNDRRFVGLDVHAWSVTGHALDASTGQILAAEADPGCRWSPGVGVDVAGSGDPGWSGWRRGVEVWGGPNDGSVPRCPDCRTWLATDALRYFGGESVGSAAAFTGLRPPGRGEDGQAGACRDRVAASMPSVSQARTVRIQDCLTTVFGWMLQMSSRSRAANMQTVTLGLTS